MGKINVLSTKKLPAPLISEAGLHGLMVNELDFISIHPYAPARIKPQLDPIPPSVQTLVFTSANAVNAANDYCQSQEITTWSDAAVFCIGRRTKESVLQAKNLGSRIAGTADYGKDLAQLIIGHHSPAVLFFCGNRRRDELPLILQEAGITVFEVVVYETKLDPKPVQEQYDAILFYSPSGVKSFFSMNRIGESTVCFAIGTTTAEAITGFTSNKVVCSKTPDPGDLINEVKKYYQATAG